VILSVDFNGDLQGFLQQGCRECKLTSLAVDDRQVIQADHDSLIWLRERASKSQGRAKLCFGKIEVLSTDSITGFVRIRTPTLQLEPEPAEPVA